MTINLHSFARDFAGRVQRVLNATICTGVKLNTVLPPNNPGIILIGYKLTRPLLAGEPFPVRVRGRAKPQCWLELSYKFCLDEPGDYATVLSSFFAIYGPGKSESAGECLCHFDYERDKSDGYPESHLQVYGKSDALDTWSGRTRSRGLEKLHFPTGGRRYRPTIEDVIEFLVVEKLAASRSGWLEILEREREEFRRIQLRAAIRRRPDIAIEALRDFGKI